jgi:hypothetical protein
MHQGMGHVARIESEIMKVTRTKQPRERLKIPLDFKQTVLAALETKPEPRKKKKAKSQNPPKKAG